MTMKTASNLFLLHYLLGNEMPLEESGQETPKGPLGKRTTKQASNGPFRKDSRQAFMAKNKKRRKKRKR